MAAVDTIVVKDNLQFTHADTTDIFSVDADKQAGEAVQTQGVVLPANVLAARVLINNAYGNTALTPGGSQVHARVRCTEVTGVTTTSVTKVQNVQALEWTAVAAGSIQESSEIDLTNVYDAMLHIDVAITGTTAHLGTEVVVQVRKEATVDEWTDWSRFVMLSGKTAINVGVASEAASGQAVIAVTNPVTSNMDHVGRCIFLLDATVANSEICYQTECGADS